MATPHLRLVTLPTGEQTIDMIPDPRHAAPETGAGHGDHDLPIMVNVAMTVGFFVETYIGRHRRT